MWSGGAGKPYIFSSERGKPSGVGEGQYMPLPPWRRRTSLGYMHQGINGIPNGPPEPKLKTGTIRKISVANGLHYHYYRESA